jgi:hypothetical protein
VQISSRFLSEQMGRKMRSPGDSFDGIKCEWDVPNDVFMLLVLDQAKMEGVSGLAKYRDEFSSVS